MVYVFWGDSYSKKHTDFCKCSYIPLSTAAMVERFLSPSVVSLEPVLNLRCYDDMPSTNSDETWGDVDTWKNNRRNRNGNDSIISIYTQKMFVSSPLKDYDLEDDPFLLRDDYHDNRTSPCSIGCTSSLIFVFWLSIVIRWFWGEKHFAAAKFVKVPGSNTLILLIRPSCWLNQLGEVWVFLHPMFSRLAVNMETRWFLSWCLTRYNVKHKSLSSLETWTENIQYVLHRLTIIVQPS